MRRPFRVGAPEYSYMRERDTTYQDACRIVKELGDDIHVLRPRVHTADDRAALTVLRGKVRKLQRWIEEGR